MQSYVIDEAQTRLEIDNKLITAGWKIQDKNRMNLFEDLGVAVREMDTDTGPADYMLFVDGKACGIIEAKREGTSLGGVAEQLEIVQRVEEKLTAADRLMVELDTKLTQAQQ